MAPTKSRNKPRGSCNFDKILQFIANTTKLEVTEENEHSWRLLRFPKLPRWCESQGAQAATMKATASFFVNFLCGSSVRALRQRDLAVAFSTPKQSLSRGWRISVQPGGIYQRWIPRLRASVFTSSVRCDAWTSRMRWISWSPKCSRKCIRYVLNVSLVCHPFLEWHFQWNPTSPIWLSSTRSVLPSARKNRGSFVPDAVTDANTVIQSLSLPLKASGVVSVPFCAHVRMLSG